MTKQWQFECSTCFSCLLSFVVAKIMIDGYGITGHDGFIGMIALFLILYPFFSVIWYLTTWWKCEQQRERLVKTNIPGYIVGKVPAWKHHQYLFTFRNPFRLYAPGARDWTAKKEPKPINPDKWWS